MQSYALRSTVDISSRVSADHQYSKSAGLWEKTGYSSSAIREVNAAFSEYDTLVRYGKQSVQKKATNQEKKKKREMYCQCCDKESETLKRSTAIAILTENESVRGYRRDNTSKTHSQLNKRR